ncbi:MAG: hypothetical protein KGL39_24250 [Patescibacteria group bacterium]|nr:hypothetical protein [Patescibacteria group bacterium]
MTPYINQAILVNAPTGIDWATLVDGHTSLTDPVVMSAIQQLCQESTGLIDTHCNQMLRATQDTEEFTPPEDRCSVNRRNGNVRALLSRTPVIAITSVQYSPNIYPLTFTVVPTNQYRVHNPSPDIYSAAGAYMFDMGSGYVDWSLDREGYVLQVAYLNGYPHCGLTAPSTTTSSTLTVDDITGWTAGTTGTIYDPSISGGSGTETFAVASTSPASATGNGPTAGTVTLTANPAYAHATGTIVSALPPTVMRAGIYLASDIAMSKGVSYIDIKPMGGPTEEHAGRPSDLRDEAYTILNPFVRRV